jgi:alkylhydroperoxidase family enzyme
MPLDVDIAKRMQLELQNVMEQNKSNWIIYGSIKHMPAFSEAERAALNFSLAASIIPNAVDQNIKKELYKYWDEGEIVEMLGVISLFGYLNRWNDSMGTSIEEGAVASGNQYLGKHGWEKGKHE